MPNWLMCYFAMRTLHIFLKPKSCEGHVCLDGLKIISITIPMSPNPQWGHTFIASAIEFSPYDGADGVAYEVHAILFSRELD